MRFKVTDRPSASECICLVAGLFFVNHYAWLLDDAFVYFRYVDNLLFLDFGLVYNAGEYVEGYSSPLWALLLIPLRAMEMHYWWIVRLVGALSFGGFWFLCVRLHRQLAPADTTSLNLPLCFLTFSYAYASYFTSGVESPLIPPIAAAYALFLLKPQSRALQIALGLSPLVRHEFAVPFALSWAYATWAQRRIPRWMTISGVVFLGGWMIFRISYYADFLPNTFYLKDTTDFAQGWRYLWDSFGRYGTFLWIAAAAALCWFYTRDRSRDDWQPQLRARVGMLLLALPVLVYVMRIGGDPRHFRYLSFPFTLCILAASGLAEEGIRRLPSTWRRTTSVVAVAVVMIASFALIPRQLAGHPIRGQVGHTPVDRINDMVVHRYHESLRHDPWSFGSGEDQLALYEDYRAAGHATAYARPVVGWWCSTLYERFNRRAVHALGLTDPYLSRVEMPADRPGHKMGLIPLAEDLAQVYGRSQQQPQRGLLRAAVQQGVAPPWIRANLVSLEALEYKAYNRHAFLENLEAASERIEPIRIPPEELQRLESNQLSQ